MTFIPAQGREEVPIVAQAAGAPEPAPAINIIRAGVSKNYANRIHKCAVELHIKNKILNE